MTAHPAMSDTLGDAPIALTREGRVLTITLANPPAHSLSMKVIERLHRALDEAKTDPGVTTIVLASTGKIFCAGHDLKEMRRHRDEDADGGRLYLEELFRKCSEMMKAIPRLPMPVIAKVDGIATAAGCQLVAACDLAFATDRSQFCTPGVNLGGFCSTPMVALSRNLSRKHSMEFLLTGDMFSAGDALRMGLLNRVVAPEDLDETVSAVASQIASKSAVAIARGKRAFYEQADMRLSEAYDHANHVMVEGFMTKDSDEGLSAFFEKREPHWRDE